MRALLFVLALASPVAASQVQPEARIAILQQERVEVLDRIEKNKADQEKRQRAMRDLSVLDAEIGRAYADAGKGQPVKSATASASPPQKISNGETQAANPKRWDVFNSHGN